MATNWYKLEDNAADDLNGAVAGGDGTIELTSAAEFPATGDFPVTVWDANTFFHPGDDDGSGSGEGMEVMLVTGVAGAVLTVTRAQAGTAAVAHGDGDAVELKLMAEHLEQITGVITAHHHAAAGDGAAVSHGDLADLGTGVDHSYIGQDVTTTGTPQLAKLGIGKAPAVSIDVTTSSNTMGSFETTAADYGRVILKFPTDADGQIAWMEAGSTKWSIGVDGSDANKFKFQPAFGAFASDVLTLTTAGALTLASFVDAVGGFKDNGVAGIDTTFLDNDGNTITVSGGIVTAKTAP